MLNELFDPYEQVLIWDEADVGIVITANEQMHLTAISERVVPDCVGSSADTFSADHDLVFWFASTDCSPDVNRMATLNLYAATTLSARVVPLLHGPVLITSIADGRPRGLSGSQLKFLRQRPEPNWWARTVLETRLRYLLHQQRR